MEHRTLTAYGIEVKKAEPENEQFISTSYNEGLLQTVKEVRETRSAETLADLLTRRGWVMLSVIKTESDFLFSLGRIIPADINGNPIF